MDNIRDLSKLIVKYFNFIGPDTRNSRKAHVIEGFAKGFLTYFVPLTLLKRKASFETFKRSIALGVFVSGIRTVDHVLRNLNGVEDENVTDLEILVRKYSLAFATFVSSLTALTIDGELHNSTLFVFWCVVRAVKCLIPSYKHGPLFIMCLSAAINLSTFASVPSQINFAYGKFLEKHGGFPKPVWDEIRTGKCNRLCHPIHAEYGFDWQGCTKYLINFFFESLPRSFKLYLPVHIIGFIFSKKKSLYYLAENLIRSSVFLSAYCTVSWMSGCIYYRFIPMVNRFNFMLHVWVAGLTLLIERPGRRIELAAYCITYSLDVIAKWGIENNLWKVSPSLNMLVISLCSAVLVHHHDQQPAMVMKWLFKLSDN